MVGQGSPRLSVASFPRGWSLSWPRGWGFCCPALLGLFCVFGLASGVLGETLGLRISWGGSHAKRWTGRISIDGGEMISWQPLGTEADEPGAILQLENRLTIAAPTPRVFQGVDVTIDASESAGLEVELGSIGEPPQRWSVPVRTLLHQPFQVQIDELGNQLLIERPPADELAIECHRPHLIFEPGETWKFQVTFRGLPFSPGTRLLLEVGLEAARATGRDPRRGLLEPLTLTRTESPTSPPLRFELTAAAGVSQWVELSLPEAEGVYEVVLTASAAGVPFRLPESVVRPLGWGSPVIQRRVQVVVLNRRSVAKPPEGSVGWKLLGEAVDATNPTFWDRLARMTPSLPRLNLLPRDGVLGRGWRRIKDVEQNVGGELGPSALGEEPTWAVYSLPVDEPGLPHLLEIEWPADRKQTLLLSVVEPNAKGAVAPPMVDLGVSSSGDLSQWGSFPTWQVHRVVFWPKTRQPLLLVANPYQESARYRRIRVYGGGDHLPEYFPPGAFSDERLVAAYFHRPLLSALFGATDVPGPFRHQGVDDWLTFYQATLRLSEYLRYAGYNAVVLSVAADGSTLFPSPRWQPTPRYDSGCFSSTGSDPIRKDILELVFRVADRDGFLVIPALDFSTPLPELEAVIQRRGEKGRALRWIGPDGQAWNELKPSFRGMSMYYNILHREVQEAVLALIHEFAARYGGHASFAGLGLQISAYGFLQLPGPEWGMDDETVARFSEETGISLEISGENRFQERARLLLGPYFRDWIRWRAQRLQSFYTRVNQELAAVRPDARLYLLSPTLFVGDRWEPRLRPSLTQRTEPLSLFQEVGLDPSAFGGDPNFAFLRVFRMVDHASLNLRATEFEIEQLYQVWQAKSPLSPPGILLYHAPREIRLPSFDAFSPYSPTSTAIIHQPLPGSYESRKRYARAFAEGDFTFIADGGWRPPWGDEEHLRVWRASLRRLPAIPFQDVPLRSGLRSLQPLVVRTAKRDQETYLYLVNQAAFPARAILRLQAPTTLRVVELSGLRTLPALMKAQEDTANWQWELDLEPYDFLAVKFNSGDVAILAAGAGYSQTVTQRLREQISELSERAAALSTPPLHLPPPNANFETPGKHPGEIPFWKVVAEADGTARLDSSEKHEGLYSLYLATRGAPVTVISSSFPAPLTGRLTVALWLKTKSPTAQPPLRVLILEEGGRLGLARYAEIGVSSAGQPVPQVGPEWTPVLIEISDLPLVGLKQLFLRVDLAGPGEVWIDDIQLCALAFSKTERVELFKLIAPAHAKLENGEVADCLRLLDGYWPRYLMEFVPRVEHPGELSRDTPPSPPGGSENASKMPDRSASLWDRVRSALPRPLRF